ncbi:MAG: hypothetical protein R3F49_05350 [Planctomycetota bacterium]
MTADELRQLFWYGSGALALVSAVLRPRAGRRAFAAVSRGAARLGSVTWRWVAVCFVLGVALPLYGAYQVRWPQPGIHDEFAYLLMAETFADGRCAMPTPALPEFFETYHVIQHPTYAAKYPPAMGVPLAIGIKLFGEPRAGLWLQAGALAASIAWMLFGWLPRRWAVIGSLVGLLRFCASGVWVQTFYNGAVAGIGGALALGALGRILRATEARPVRGWHGALLAVGLGILANSRPFEGLVLGLVLAVALALWVVRRARRGALGAVRRLAAPAVVVLVACGAAMARYNYLVTGSATRLPYSVYDEQYAIYPPFLWQPLHEAPPIRHAVMREFSEGFQRGGYGAWGDASAMLDLAQARATELAFDFVGWPLWLPLALFILRPRRRGVRWAAAALAATFAALCTTTYLEPRYAAPVVSAMLLLVTFGLANLRRLPLVGRRLGRRLGPTVTLAFLFAFGATYVQDLLETYPPPISWFGRVRAEVVRQLDASPGEDLVFVRYVEGHQPHHEWVVNGAHIDAQPIIWARDLGAAENARLIERYPERTLWTLTSGELLRDGPILDPYAAPR